MLTERLSPNALIRSKVSKKVYIGNEYDDLNDKSGLAFRRPMEKVLFTRLLTFVYISNVSKGYLTNWEVEKVIWDRIIRGNERLDVSKKYTYGKKVFL